MIHCYFVIIILFGRKPLIELGVNNTKLPFFSFGPFSLAPEPIIKGEDGLILQLNSRTTESLCCKFTQTGRMMSPKGSLEVGKFTVGTKAKSSGSVRPLSSYFRVWE